MAIEAKSLRKNHLTDKQSKFVDYYIAEGKTQTEAARLAGYSFPEYEGYRLVRQPRMIQVIQAARQKYYHTNCFELSLLFQWFGLFHMQFPLLVLFLLVLLQCFQHFRI